MQSAPQRHGGSGLLVLELLALSILWLLFSGKFDLLHLAYGALSVALVLVLTRHLLRSSDPRESSFLARTNPGQAISYPFWLAWQILLANLEVMKVILGPSSRLDPQILSFRFPVEGAVPKVVLGNSITVTPGTFTLRIIGDRLVVHSIGPGTAAGILDGTMQKRAAALFNAKLDPLPEVELRSHFVEADRGPDE